MNGKIVKNQISGFRRRISEVQGVGRDVFFTWFDEAKNAGDAFINGAWDFSANIAAPLMKYLNLPCDKTVLEIGYGGGRLLASASRHFKNAIGVDVHVCTDMVMEELRNRGVNNIQLISTGGKSIPLKDGSLGVVYSFIVLQHVEKINIFEKYIEETYRVLTKGGLAVIYFGRYARFSVGKKSRVLYGIDRILERIVLRRGFKEIPSEINCINLIISMSCAKKLARRAGFEVCDALVSLRRGPSGETYGLQNGLVLKK